MGKKLAIKGHPTRGKEVIEILEMMGGVNSKNVDGKCDFLYYFIDNDNTISCDSNFNNNFVYFTLEKFWEKYPFKVGDKVVYTKYGDNCDDYPVTIESMKWTGTTIEYTFDDCVTCLAKDLKMWNEEPDAVISGINLNSCDYADEVELNLGNYEIEVRGNRTYAVKKKPKYPKTYEECCKILDIRWKKNYAQGYKCGLISKFQELYIARSVYWKIAGEQMGLGKPWDSTHGCGEWGYWIGYNINENKIYLQDSRILVNHTLVFPTEEMRNAFYDNFKDLIEQCKELL